MACQRICPKCRKVFFDDEKYCDIDHEKIVLQNEDDAEPPADALLNKVLGGKYRIGRKLGQGGMGAVYEASHLKLNRRVAVKVMLQGLGASDGKAVPRFRREAQASGRLSAHPNIVIVHDFGQEPLTPETPQETRGLLYLVMEFLAGHTLWEQMNGGPLSCSLAVSIALQVAEALNFAHQKKVVHRDIKPANIFVLDHEGRSDFVKVVDFGIARLLDEKAITVDPSQILGTADYLAPEAWQRPDKPGPAMDLYALGITMFEMLTGQPPFATNEFQATAELHAQIFRLMQSHLNEIPPSVSSRRKASAPLPKELDRLIAELLEKEPTKRPNARDAAERLRRLQKEVSCRSVSGALLSKTVRTTIDTITHLRPATSEGPSDGPTRRMTRERVGMLDATTMPIQNARYLQLRQAGEQLELVEEQLEEVSGNVSQLTRKLLTHYWPQSMPEDVARLAGRVSYLDAERTAQQKHLEEMEAERQQESSLRIADRDNIQDQIVNVLARLREEPSLDEESQRVLEEQQIELEWKRDAIKTDSSMAARHLELERSFHALVYALHHARWQMADGLARALANRGGFIQRFRRSEPELAELRAGIGRLDGLLSQVRSLWEIFPTLKPQETIHVPAAATIQLASKMPD